MSVFALTANGSVSHFDQLIAINNSVWFCFICTIIPKTNVASNFKRLSTKLMLKSKSNPWNPIALCAICFCFSLHSISNLKETKNCLLRREIKNKKKTEWSIRLTFGAPSRKYRIELENEKKIDTDFLFVYSNNLMKINRITLPKVQVIWNLTKMSFVLL